MASRTKAWVCERLACRNCGFESQRGHGCLSLMSVVCYQAEVSASGSSLVQRSPADCGLATCDREASIGETMTRNPDRSAIGESERNKNYSSPTWI